jgi:hypothetical protein
MTVPLAATRRLAATNFSKCRDIRSSLPRVKAQF